MMRRHGSNGNPQSERESIAKHPEDEDVSQFAHLKNAPPSSAGFFWGTLEDWDSERTEREHP
jgi:hypothetical protein